MRISDWSSDVCSSDLRRLHEPLRGDIQGRLRRALERGAGHRLADAHARSLAEFDLAEPTPGAALGAHALDQDHQGPDDQPDVSAVGRRPRPTGRASCRERVWKYE